MARARILVVDDQPGMLRVVERVLAPKYDVVCAAAPSEGLVLAKEFSPELAILDIRMPEMTGFELMERLGAAHPGIDVILMTGSVGERDAHLIRAIQAGAFYFIRKPFDREVLSALVSRCLDLRRLREERDRHLARLRGELEQARLFQWSMLPPPHHAADGITLAARYTPCDELGGDFYDYVRSDSGATAVIVADASGHGVSAAMMTGVVKSAFRASRADDFDPAAVIDRIVKAVRAFEARRFVTLFCGRISPDRSQLEYVNAGHPPGLLWTHGESPTALESTGPLVSSGFPDLHWEQNVAPLSPGSRLLLYSDGIIEVRGLQGWFGQERLVEIITSSGRDGAALLDAILDSVKEFSGNRPYEDDLTMLGVTLGLDESSNTATID